MIRRSLGLVVVLILSSGLLPQIARAHVLQTDGSIGAVLHVTPDDDPIVGETSNFYFEFKDKAGKFSPAACRCTVAVVQAQQEIFSQPLLPTANDPSLSSASFSFVFPAPDVYQVEVRGEPVEAKAFAPFKLVYDLRVERTSSSASPAARPPWLFIGLGGAATIAIAYLIFKKN